MPDSLTGLLLSFYSNFSMIFKPDHEYTHEQLNMNNNKHIERLQKAVDDWLSPGNFQLKQAIDRTVHDGFFSFPDIKHRILSLKRSLKKDSLNRWVEKNKLMPGSLGSHRVLCLHAGNLPLMGVQDVIASTLAGIEYRGKISRKDPYLLPTLLGKLKAHNVLAKSLWSTNIRDLSDSRADAVMFSGSSRSVKPVRKTIQKHRLAKDNAEYLIRTAHYSVAVIDQTDPATMENLVEAVFRYGGKGCRSVAVVFAPFSLDSIKCELTDYIEAFWLKNPQHQKPRPSLYHRFAYNKAVGHPQSWLDNFLIEQTEMPPEHDFVLHWVAGEMEKVPRFIEKHGAGLQSVYISRKGMQIQGLKHQPVLLGQAQSPPIDWKPDGIDTLAWLVDKIHA